MDLVTIISTYGVASIAILAFIVSIIVEVTKGFSFVKKIPTDLVVIVVSMVVTLVSYLGAISYFNRAFAWYELVVAIVAAFVVAFISMYGWEKLSSLWDRFKQK